ncbi:substrate-binding domain-containing protein [Falsiroseomonas stagni]|uniref:Phosphate ABC transporter substrate-binding protein, PhoT family n=1 Tax=Falsiroseomonas stagni DSM 19981 TaxID=1123062 RepID=A0A1I3XLD4_9PROT|nr:substrate-binding domain-containing protein [Falsiroseomonas stagni]SFK20332.1 phosphate ABC transporter substrate-binding protein, PhoT family [Falsiroseomonas stagni DSM 19981]
MIRAPDNPEFRHAPVTPFRMGRRALLLATLPACIPRGAARAEGLTFGGTGMAIAIVQRLLDEQTRLGLGGPAIVLNSLGSAGGLAALRAGRIDIALSGRPLTAAEQAQGLVATTFATNPLAFATHAATPVEGITLAQVVDALSGEMMSWPGGGPLRLIRRDRAEGDWILLASLSPEIAQAVDRAHARPGLATAGTDQENAELLERIPGSFGVISVGQAITEGRRVKLLPLDGVAPTAEALAAGRYRLSRALVMVTRAEPGAAVASFLAFLASPPARAVLRQHGYEPVPASGA